MVAEIVHVPVSTKVTTPEDELIVHTEVVELENVLSPAPALGVAVMVGGVSFRTYVAACPARVRVRLAAVIVNVTAVAVAPAFAPSAVIDAPILQVPASTKVTTPVVESMVQIDAAFVENVVVPPGADELLLCSTGLATIVGGVAVNTYDALLPDRLRFRAFAVMVNDVVAEVAEAYGLDAAMVA